MRKSLTSIAAAAAIATGPLMASGLYAQESGRQEMPGGKWARMRRVAA